MRAPTFHFTWRVCVYLSFTTSYQVECGRARAVYSALHHHHLESSIAIAGDSHDCRDVEMDDGNLHAIQADEAKVGASCRAVCL